MATNGLIDSIKLVNGCVEEVTFNEVEPAGVIAEVEYAKAVPYADASGCEPIVVFAPPVKARAFCANRPQNTKALSLVVVIVSVNEVVVVTSFAVSVASIGVVWSTPENNEAPIAIPIEALAVAIIFILPASGEAIYHNLVVLLAELLKLIAIVIAVSVPPFVAVTPVIEPRDV